MSLLRFDQMPDPAAAEQELAQLLTQTFSVPADSWNGYVEQVGRDNFRMLLDERSGLEGGLGIYRTRQWFGGCAIPMGAIAAVGVRPELRGGGTAFRLMSLLLRELRETGTPLSALYASTSRLYRKVGYEHAGSSYLYEVSTQDLGASRPEADALRPVDPVDHERFRALQEAAARETNGSLERPPGMWTRISRKLEGVTYAYVTGEEDRPTGYVIYEQRDDGQSGRMLLRVRDWVGRTPGARAAILKLFAGHRSIRSAIQWRGPAIDPWMSLFPEQETRAISIERWLLRITDVSAALEARGYPPGVEGALELSITDEIVTENTGHYRLEVSAGKGKVTSTRGSSGLSMSVRALAPLYSGFHSPRELANLGWIEGGGQALEVASRIFAGPEPWMADGF